MLESVWGQAGLGAAFLALATWVIQANIRGTWRPAAWTKELLQSKDELIALKDAQIVLLTSENNVKQTTIDAQITQIGALSEALGAVQHFFQEVPVVPSKGAKVEKVET